jgi:hypothetical protein
VSDLPFESAFQAPTIKSSVGAKHADPDSKSKAGKSYIIFGKKDSTAIELSAIASGTGGFVINGENANYFAEDDIGLSCS